MAPPPSAGGGARVLGKVNEDIIGAERERPREAFFGENTTGENSKKAGIFVSRTKDPPLHSPVGGHIGKALRSRVTLRLIVATPRWDSQHGVLRETYCSVALV